jgi:hypothetical protein
MNPPESGCSRLGPPLIIIGMHRSGTTMITRLLDDCGMFVGRDLNEHHESRYFLGLNDGVLGAGGGSWERVEPYLASREDAAFLGHTTAALAASLASGFDTGYLSLPKRAALRLGKRFPWGWKDPRTCLVMPQWLRIFPGARLLHIIRHPLDVALSFVKREAFKRDRGWDYTGEVLDVAYSLRLWDLYLGECLRCRALRERYLEVRFEDLLAHPVMRLREICGFAGLEVPERDLARAAAMVDESRQRRFDGPALEQWEARLRGLAHAAEFGYA